MGGTFFSLGMKTAQSGYCTVMADAQLCRSVPYYSNPDIMMPALRFRIFGQQHQTNINKPPERLGTALRNNARWIRINRFILQNVGDELMTCPNVGYKIYPFCVERIIENDPEKTCNSDW